MKQGDIWIADLEPVRGSEQGGMRPILIVSGNALNNTLPIVVSVPLSSQVKSYPTAVEITPSSENGLDVRSEALPFQIRAVAKTRLKKQLGVASSRTLQDVLKGVALILTR